ERQFKALERKAVAQPTVQVGKRASLEIWGGLGLVFRGGPASHVSVFIHHILIPGSFAIFGVYTCPFLNIEIVDRSAFHHFFGVAILSDRTGQYLVLRQFGDFVGVVPEIKGYVPTEVVVADGNAGKLPVDTPVAQ